MGCVLENGQLRIDPGRNIDQILVDIGQYFISECFVKMHDIKCTDNTEGNKYDQQVGTERAKELFTLLWLFHGKCTSFMTFFVYISYIKKKNERQLLLEGAEKGERGKTTPQAVCLRLFFRWKKRHMGKSAYYFPQFPDVYGSDYMGNLHKSGTSEKTVD